MLEVKFMDAKTIITKLGLDYPGEDKISSARLLILRYMKQDPDITREFSSYFFSASPMFAYRIIQDIENDTVANLFWDNLYRNIKTVSKKNMFEVVLFTAGLNHDRVNYEINKFIVDNIDNVYTYNSNQSVIVGVHCYLISTLDGDYLGKIDSLFYDNFAVYDSLYDRDLECLVKNADRKSLYKTLNRLVEIIGLKKLQNVIGNIIYDYVRQMIVLDSALPITWHRYMDHLIEKKYSSIEEKLVEYDWFIQINCDGDSDLLSYFLWKQYECGNEAERFSELFQNEKLKGTFGSETLSLVRGIIKIEIKNNAERITDFIKNNSGLNPFSFRGNCNDDNDIIFDFFPDKDEANISRNNVVLLFESGMCFDDIFYVYFNTYINQELAIEDFYEICALYGKSDECIEKLKAMEFNGYVKRVEGGNLRIASTQYRSLHLHNAFYHESRREFDEEIRMIPYAITGISHSTVLIKIINDDGVNSLESDIEVQWKTIISFIEKIRISNIQNLSEEDIYVIENNSRFNISEFYENLNLSELFESIIENNINITLVVEIFNHLVWNERFRESNDKNMDVIKMRPLEKYRVSGIRLIKYFCSNENIKKDKDKKILDFYFNSSLKSIVQMEIVLGQLDYETFVEYIRDKVFYCKIGGWKTDDLYSLGCRIENCLSYTARIYVGGIAKKGDEFKSKFMDLEKDNYGHTKLVLEQFYDAKVSQKDYKSVFKLISKTKSDSYTRLLNSLPQESAFVDNNILFFADRISNGLYLRRNIISSVNNLITRLGVLNPFLYSSYINATFLPYKQGELQKKQAEALFNSLLLNCNNVSTFVDIILNSHIKVEIGLNKIYQKLTINKSKLKDGFVDELNKKKWIAFRFGNKVYSPFIDFILDTEIQSDSYNFFYFSFGEEKGELIVVSTNEIDDIEEEKCIILTMLYFDKIGEYRLSFIERIFGKYGIRNYKSFCEFLGLKREERRVQEFFNKFVEFQSMPNETNEKLFKNLNQRLNSYRFNSGSFISCIQEGFEKIYKNFGYDAANEFISKWISFIIDLGTFDDSNEYSLYMAAVDSNEKCIECNDDIVVNYLKKAYFYVHAGIINSRKVEKKLIEYNMEPRLFMVTP